MTIKKNFKQKSKIDDKRQLSQAGDNITLEQFVKFANDNDILWFYNKPEWSGADTMIVDDYVIMVKKEWNRLKEHSVEKFPEKTSLIKRLLHWQKSIKNRSLKCHNQNYRGRRLF